ncbi:hypothetical protein A0J48_020790 [Sphaerospermopsis aphanizomenoides BCCUSP55]|uniref:hypothetical protein n=1 Tax=Sphaerospermopsis aphanizomenoides TaxID=459663 RepID=UPI000B16597D|nr:hypothetical protein [Sphaerospermopsis aphanizomenoides]MBK1989938.1 hypothetical protein [Sphaerospermopsis aphanizomenoides BCCUSP55]
MIIKLTKCFFAVVLVVVLALFSPGMTTASANDFFSYSPTIFTSFSKDRNTVPSIAFAENDLTPQEHQKLQAVRQRRNKEILAVLNNSQRQQLAHQLHLGSELEQALETLNLSNEQRDLINAVIDFTNLKLKGIFSHHALLESHN